MLVKQGGWNARSTMNVRMQFKTYAREGVLLAVGKGKDYLLVSIHEGRVTVEWDLGSGQGQVESDSDTMNDGNEHLIVIEREKQHVSLTVDKEDGMVIVIL